MKPHFYKGRIFLVLGLSALMAACAGPGPRPEGEMQSARSAIEAAEADNAREYEPVMLKRAQNKLAEAEELLEDRKNREAKRKLDEAKVDAELASARTETAQARVAVEELNRNIEAMRERINGEQAGGQQ